jgi:hypothetical protein
VNNAPGIRFFKVPGLFFAVFVRGGRQKRESGIRQKKSIENQGSDGMTTE